MKAIFAVTALAAAISGQALAADTETTTTFTGAMDARVIYNLAESTEATDDLGTVVVPSSFDVDLDDDDDFLYGLSMEMAVTNGPFSGTLTIESDEDSAITPVVEDLIVTDGKLSFGQVGGLMSTDEYIDASVEMAGDDDMEDGIGFRYAAAEGFTVQLGGDESNAAKGTAIIASAQYAGAAGALAYVVEGQMKASAVGSELDADAPMFVGAAATYSADNTTVMAALNYTSDTAGETDMDYAVNATTTVASATLTAGYLERSGETDDDEELFVGAAYAMDAISLSAGYLLTTAEEAGDEVTAGLGYAAGAMSYSADITLANFDAATADAVLIELGVSTVSAAGVTYYGEFEMQAEGDTGAITTAETSKLTVGGKYSF
jgi:hypothetical protein